jgi:hypothetical protein
MYERWVMRDTPLKLKKMLLQRRAA